MSFDPCELAPSYVRSIAPYQPGKPISELAREMGLTETEMDTAESAANLLNLGKIMIPPEVLALTGDLTEEER